MKFPYIIEKLDTKKHARELFNCGVDILNLYLKERANQEQKKWLNITYVAIFNANNKRSPIIGYYTLSNSSITLASLTSELKHGVPLTYDIPSIKIGRLAVDISYQNQGVGSLLLKNAFTRIIEIASLSGVRGVEVVAKNKMIQGFYKKFGFIELADAANILFLPTATILNA